MRRFCFLVLLMAHAAYGEDPFACVDSDVADAFLGDSYRGRGEYSTTIPAGFTELNVPKQLSLVGSQGVDSVMTVVYKADMSAESAHDAAVNAMVETGWVEDAEQHHRSGGFQTRPRLSATVLCKDDFLGALSVMTADKANKTFVSFMQHSGSHNCGRGEQQPPRHDPSEMMDRVPTLKLPPGAEATDMGMGGSGHQVSSRVDISGSSGRAELLSHFESQIRDQQWEFQTSWSSHHSSGSVWALDTAEDGLLIGTLHLFDSGFDPIRVRFSLTPADPEKGKNRGSWSGTTF